MDKQPSEENILNDIDYRLWVMLDHLRYMICKSRRKELARYSVTPEQAQILFNIGYVSAITLDKLVEYTQHQHHSISTLINRMATKGLVNRTTIPGRGKKLYISITEKGRELLMALRRDSFTAIFSCLSIDDKHELMDLFSRLLINSYKELGKDNIPLCINEPASPAISNGNNHS